MARRFIPVLAMSRSGTSLAVGITLFIVTGCAYPIKPDNAQSYHLKGVTAERAGNLESARENYNQALIKAKLENAPTAGISMVTYNLGRVTGFLGDCKEAERLLLDALDLETKATGPLSGMTSTRLFELARLNYDQGRYPESVSYYDRAVPIAQKLSVDRDDPIAVAEMLGEYADALRRTGRIDDAEKTESKATYIRNRSPKAHANFTPTRYRHCTK